MSSEERSWYLRLRRVPFWYRSSDSARLDPKREWQLFRQAQRNLFGDWRASATLVGAPLVIVVFFFLFAPHSISDWYMQLLLIGVVGPTFIMIVHTRRELARLAREAPKTA
jgi:hypothetical protein